MNDYFQFMTCGQYRLLRWPVPLGGKSDPVGFPAKAVDSAGFDVDGNLCSGSKCSRKAIKIVM